MERIPFTYGEFYDFPRMIELRFGTEWYFLRSYFDEEKDDYLNYYNVYLLPFQSEEEIRANPDYWMNLNSATHLGKVLIDEVGFDDTRRKSIDAPSFQKWLALNPKPG